MSAATHSTVARHRRPCKLYSQGHCRFGDKCRFIHGLDVQPSPGTIGTETHPDATFSDPPSSSPPHDTSDARPRPKRGEIPCRAWKAGTCTRGSKCWFGHDIDKPRVDFHRTHKQKTSATSGPVQSLVEEGPSAPPNADVTRAERDLLQAERARLQAAVAAAAACERAKAIREEAAKTISQVVFGSIVTFSAGLDVPSLITGYETCTLRIGNLPFHVKEDDIHELLRSQGLDAHHFHVVIKKGPDHRPGAHILTDIATGRAVSLGLDGVEFHEETLIVEMSATNSLEGMSAAGGQSSDILTISWRAPSARYVAEYVDIATARAKVEELDRLIYNGRRLKVEMNAQPRGRFVPNLSLNAIKINNLPNSVTDEDVLRITGSMSVKRLSVGGPFGLIHTVQQFARFVRDDIERAVPGGVKKFEDPHSTCTMEGVVSARAHFSSWDEAHTAYTHLSDKRYGSQTVWLRLPDPMYFTLIVPMEQYKAQKAQWDSLQGSIKDRKACALNVRETGNVVRIRLSGSVKEATGALKVRVENLARGDKVEGWHRSFGIPGNPFVAHVHSETGAYVRADWKRQSLKVYGAPKATDQAREMIKDELDRLASLDYTVTIARHSVGFFVREGTQQLKETLGENNVRFATSSRKITVSGGEEARHMLDRLIMLSHKGSSGLSAASQDNQTCPICYDNVSSPHQLGCGHTYCVACLRHFISSTLESDQLPLTCLGDEARCRIPIPIPTIQQFLPPASFNRLLEAAFDAYIAKHPEEFKHCRTPDCTQIYRAVQAGATPQTLHCPSCFSAICNACHEDAHDGLTCAQGKARRDPAEQERLNDAWIASQNGRVKKCPQCSVPIEKLEGCNHMTCRCGAHICWRCMGIFTAETIYPHMHTAHGTIHGDAPAVPEPPVNIGFEVDIGEQRELLRQVEARRAARLQNARLTWWDLLARERPHEEDTGWEGLGGIQRQREEQEGRLGDLRQIREEHERRLREIRQFREADELDRRLREAREREELDRRLREAREREERERRLREQRLREVEQRRRAQEQQRDGGWGCMIM